MNVVMLVVLKRHSVHQHLSGIWDVEVFEKCDAGRLSGARRSDQGNSLSRLDSEGEISEDGLI